MIFRKGRSPRRKPNRDRRSLKSSYFEPFTQRISRPFCERPCRLPNKADRRAIKK